MGTDQFIVKLQLNKGPFSLVPSKIALYPSDYNSFYFYANLQLKTTTHSNFCYTKKTPT